MRFLVTIPWHDPRLASEIKRTLESTAFEMFWQLGSYATFDQPLLEQLSEFDFREILYGWEIHKEDAERFFNSVGNSCRYIRRHKTHGQLVDTSHLASENNTSVFFTVSAKVRSKPITWFPFCFGNWQKESDYGAN